MSFLQMWCAGLAIFWFGYAWSGVGDEGAIPGVITGLTVGILIAKALFT